MKKGWSKGLDGKKRRKRYNYGENALCRKIGNGYGWREKTSRRPEGRDRRKREWLDRGYWFEIPKVSLYSFPSREKCLAYFLFNIHYGCQVFPESYS